MAHTPQKTGTFKHRGLWLKKAVLASYLASFPHIGHRKSGLMVFGVTAMVVPPPFGFISGVMAAAAFNLSATAGQNFLRDARRAFGFAARCDFEILGEFNRQQRAGTRLIVPLQTPLTPLLRHIGQKTVFPLVEMR